MSGAIAHFLQATKRYWPGRFACYQCPDIPRTNNPPGVLLRLGTLPRAQVHREEDGVSSDGGRGRVRLVAAVASQAHTVSAEALIPTDRDGWRGLRAELESRHEACREQLWFRRDPDAFLTRLDPQLLKDALPP